MLRLYSWGAAYVGHAALFTGSVWVVIFLALGNPGNQTGNQAGCDTPTSASTSLSKESEFCDLVFSLEKEVSSRENCHKHSFYHLWVSSRHEMLKIALILKCIKATATLMEGAPLNIYGKLVTKNPYYTIKKNTSVHATFSLLYFSDTSKPPQGEQGGALIKKQNTCCSRGSSLRNSKVSSHINPVQNVQQMRQEWREEELELNYDPVTCWEGVERWYWSTTSENDRWRAAVQFAFFFSSPKAAGLLK